MKKELNNNLELLLVYFNVMILSKAFKLNKIFSLNEAERDLDTRKACRDKIKSLSESSTVVNDQKTDEQTKPRSSTNVNELNKQNITSNFNNYDSSWIASSSSSTFSNISHNFQFNYDADIEVSFQDQQESNEQKRYDLNGYTSPSNFRYDLILFPRILEICLKCILEKKQSVESIDNLSKNKQNSSQQLIIEIFLKRLLHLVETCNLNIQILLNNNFRNFFVDMLPTPFQNLEISQYIDQKCVRYCFEILYYLCLYDMNENLFTKLFEMLIENKYFEKIEQISSFSNGLFLREMCSSLILKLSKNLQFIQSTHFLRMPYQKAQEPIDHLLHSDSLKKKWKINLNNYEGFASSTSANYNYENLSNHNNSFNNSKTFSKLASDINGNTHLSNRMVNESGEKLCCIKIPLNVTQSSSLKNSISSSSQEFIKINSYSLAFALRFDNNLINFSKSYGLNRNDFSKKYQNISNDSYAHLVSVNFEILNSSFEIWINSNGNLLFLRRIENNILFTMNLIQLSSNVWHFIHVNYEEKEINDSINNNNNNNNNNNKFNCSLSYCLNATEILNKEFEIQYATPFLAQTQHKQQQNNYNNSCLFIGHEEKNNEFNYLFHYDLGQVILSKGNQLIYQLINKINKKN
jgi:hypothetical protein